MVEENFLFEPKFSIAKEELKGLSDIMSSYERTSL
jgi:hypothetical protein